MVFYAVNGHARSQSCFVIFQGFGGTLVFRGTRVPAQSLLDYLNDGFSVAEFLTSFPSVREEDAREFLKLSELKPK